MAALHRHLPRLNPQAYRGHAFVHWTMTIAGRRTGWLTPELHHRTRELLLHVLWRERGTCPAYTLMPDHMHFVIIGTAPDSDQQSLVRYLRLHLNRALAACAPDVQLQRSAYDRVLREQDRQRYAFEQLAHYILDNPVRAGLVASAGEYPYSGCVVPGLPGLHPQQPSYWQHFWAQYEQQLAANQPCSCRR